MDDNKFKLLIVDDSADVRDSLKRILEMKGYDVLAAASAEEGLETIKNQTVDIIFCDLMLPAMDGFDFLKNLREFNLKAEVIIITGHSTIDRCVEAIERNACGYLMKPFTIDEVMENLQRAQRRIIERKEMIRRAMLDKIKKEDAS